MSKKEKQPILFPIIILAYHPFVQIYALLSEGGRKVPEADLVPSLVWYNKNCAESRLEKLDGVAVSNQDFDRQGSKEEKSDYLKNLAKIG